MQLSREKFFRLNDASRERIYASRLRTTNRAHAKWSAIRYARLLLADGVVENDLTYRGRFGWTPKMRLELAGGAQGIKNTMRELYGVSEEFLLDATLICATILKEGRA